MVLTPRGRIVDIRNIDMFDNNLIIISSNGASLLLRRLLFSGDHRYSNQTPRSYAESIIYYIYR